MVLDSFRARFEQEVGSRVSAEVTPLVRSCAADQVIEALTGGEGEVNDACSGAGESCSVAMGGGEGWLPGWCSYWPRSSDLYTSEDEIKHYNENKGASGDRPRLGVPVC